MQLAGGDRLTGADLFEHLRLQRFEFDEPTDHVEHIEQHISNQLEAKLPKVVSEQLKQISPPPIWMTEKQLAEYWQLRTPSGEITVHSIRKWTARPENEHPLPCASMGEMRRYHREEVGQRRGCASEEEEATGNEGCRYSSELSLHALIHVLCSVTL